MTDPAASAPTVDFTRVNGVGPKSAEALTKAGVTTMRELASMTVEEVVEALRDNGVDWPAGRIVTQGWLQQAWRLSREQASAPGRSAEGDPGSVLDEENGFDAAAANGNANANGWSEHTGFFVYFDR